MYHRKSIQTLQLAAIITLTATTTAWASAEVPTNTHGNKITVGIDKTEWQLPPSVKQLKNRPHRVDIFAYDDRPVGNRAPLLLVHGMKGEFWDCFRWRQVCEHLMSNKDIDSKYKIFLARYDSYLPLAEVSPAVGKQIIRLSAQTGGKPVTLLALSMGGNVVAQAMGEPGVSDAVRKVIALGTPFHGTPLFTSDWMTYSMLRHYRTPLARLDECLPYRIYFSKHENLLTDLRWDNSDKFVPAVGRYRYYFPLRLSGTLSPDAVANDYLRTVEKTAIDKSKFTVYGGYLRSAFTQGHHVNPIKAALHYPVWFARTTIPEHCGKEHPVLRVCNQHIARAIPNDRFEKQFERTYPYGLNDGITPLASSLFLPDSALSARAFSTPADVKQLPQLLDVAKARVFENIDHLTFIDGYVPPGGSNLLKDELNPKEERRSIFDWIATDVASAPGDRLAETK